MSQENEGFQALATALGLQSIDLSRYEKGQLDAVTARLRDVVLRSLETGDTRREPSATRVAVGSSVVEAEKIGDQISRATRDEKQQIWA